METRTSDEYISNRAWFRDVLFGENLILMGVSALEYLQLFVGYVGENEIDVYAIKEGQYSNINYHVINNFNEIDFFQNENIFCSSANQAFNDLFADYENADEQALVEALSKYYYTHGMSFEGLDIIFNKEKFEELKKWAINFYSGVMNEQEIN